MDRYGPNTAEVERLLERMETITAEEDIALGKAWKGGKAWDAAWDNARGSSRKSDRSDAVSDAWRIIEHLEVWDDDWDAARDAVLALVVRDLISQEDFDVLYGPWASVMEVEHDR